MLEVRKKLLLLVRCDENLELEKLKKRIQLIEHPFENKKIKKVI